MVAGERFYRDSAGQEWKADSWFSSGRIIGATAAVRGTAEPDLYARERIGRFTYSAPVKTFHRTEASPQRTLEISFVPVAHDASVRAIEVLDEGR